MPNDEPRDNGDPRGVSAPRLSDPAPRRHENVWEAGCYGTTLGEAVRRHPFVVRASARISLLEEGYGLKPAIQRMGAMGRRLTCP